MAQREFLTRWLPVLAWGLLISTMSTGYFSGEATGSFILPVLFWLFPGASHEQLELIHHLIRKFAHFTEYFVLGVLLYRALRVNPVFGLPTVVGTLLVAAVYAGCDEFHQALVSGRSASAFDWLLDTAGSAASLIVRVLVPRRIRW